MYVAASEAETGRTLVALGLLDLLARRVERIGIFRPVVEDLSAPDPLIDLLTAQAAPGGDGVDDHAVHEDPEAALGEILDRYAPLAEQCESVLVVGSDLTDVGAPVELAFNARVAVSLGAAVVGVVNGARRAPEEMAAAVDVAYATLGEHRCDLIGMIANRVDPERVDAVRERLVGRALAIIAVPSAVTAQQFGVEPRVAMLSYVTGESGSEADVDRMREATALVRERAPDLLVEGPIQYDAAIDPNVSRTKMLDSPVAGRATVFVFPDLNTGNTTYKAVQRSTEAVRDMVNTVAITVVQAAEAGVAERVPLAA